MEQESITWSAPEFEYREKGSDWYWITGIVAVFGSLISIVFGNLLFALLIIIGAFVMVLYGSKHPDTINCEINRRGVRVDKKMYLFNSLESFWVDETNENKPKLLITSKSTFALQVVLSITKDMVEDIKDYLSNYLPEIEQNESVTERIMEWIKF